MRAFLMIGVLAAAISTSAAAQDGKAIYETHCQKCHHADGKPIAGIKKMNPKIEDFNAAFFASKKDADMEAAIAKGKDKMKPFGDKLKPEEITAVVKYIKATFK